MAWAVDRAVETIRALAATTELDYVDISWGASKPLPMRRLSIPCRSVDCGTSSQPSQRAIAQSGRHLSIRRGALPTLDCSEFPARICSGRACSGRGSTSAQTNQH